MAIEGAKLDVNGIVGQLMSIEQRPIAVLNKKEGDYQAKISAYGNISGALSSFQNTVQELTNLEKLKTLKTTSSDPAIFTASSSGKAAKGSHSFSVSALAQAQKLAVTGQASDNNNIGTGTPSKLTFDFGSIAGGKLDAANGKYTDATFTTSGQGVKTVTIDSSNNSLQGIRDAINSAKMGVTATIINDGSSAPAILTLSSNNTGVSNSIKISVAGDPDLTALLAHDPAGVQNLTQSVTAQNASFTVDGVNINKSSNTVSDVIPDVTLNLLDTTDTPVSLTITSDNGALTTLVQNFAKGYNDLNKTVLDLSSYNAATKQGAILQGDSTVRLLQSQMREVLNTPIKDTGGAYTNLAQIGVTIQKDGTMAVDTVKLNAAIEKNPTDVASLFATLGRPSDPLLTFSTAGSNTKAGSYPVKITQVATQGSFAGCEDYDSLIIKRGKNDALDVTIDGVNAAITLSEGEYTVAGLAAEVQSKINGDNTMAKAGASVSVSHDQFGYIITSNSFGSKSSVDISGEGLRNIFGEAPVVTQGADVAGTINGAAASGTGKTLTSTEGAALGLKVTVGGGNAGERGKVNYSQGYAQNLNTLLTAMLAKEGPLQSRQNGINTSIKDITSHRETLQQRLPLQEARYRKQYSTLETTLSNMSKTSSYLSQQLSSLPRPY